MRTNRLGREQLILAPSPGHLHPVTSSKLLALFTEVFLVGALCLFGIHPWLKCIIYSSLDVWIQEALIPMAAKDLINAASFITRHLLKDPLRSQGKLLHSALFHSGFLCLVEGSKLSRFVFLAKKKTQYLFLIYQKRKAPVLIAVLR